MINLQIWFADGTSTMIYDVHPRSQDKQPGGIPLPAGATGITVWLGTR